MMADDYHLRSKEACGMLQRVQEHSVTPGGFGLLDIFTLEVLRELSEIQQIISTVHRTSRGTLQETA